MVCPTRPPVHDSALAICQPRFTSARPSLRAAESRSASVGGRSDVIASSVVLELEGDRVVQRPEVRDHGLELVTRLGGDAHRVALDRWLRLREGLADALRELLRLLARQSAAELDLLAHGAASGRLDLAPIEDLEGEAAAHRLGLEPALGGAGTVLVVGGQDDRVLVELERDLAALEIVPGRDLATGLVERVDQLLLVEVAHHVER